MSAQKERASEVRFAGKCLEGFGFEVNGLGESLSQTSLNLAALAQ